ncbi:MAG: Signal transduction histidine kinase [Rhodobacteraceae bacterium HLUCCO07]|nr:MAG: Signal transduction histidine kinase [Rhodobacteraceae bacterium HLUCCO07]
MRHLFKSLRAQLVLLILGCLVIAQVVSLWLLTDERGLAVRAAIGAEAAGRAANVVRLLEEAPPELRHSILRAANSPLVRFDLAPAPLVITPDHHHGDAVVARMRALLDERFSREIRVNLREAEMPAMLPAHLDVDGEMARMHRQMMRERITPVELTLSVALSGGEWLNVATRFERPPLQWRSISILSFGVTAALLLVAVFWFLLTRLTGPLRRLSGAADRLGRGEDAGSLPVAGPTEVRDLTAAFNRMQERLTRFVVDRTRLLAAVSHDLRSPLTALRVRAELVDDEETRESLIESIEEMQMMAEATLTFAEGLSESDPPQTIQVADWLEALSRDMVEAFEISGGPELRARIRPLSLRRAIRNVIENAIRYGGAARVGWHRARDHLVIDVTDTGPGIPAGMIERVFDPFFRLEESRSLETGGHGLGLSIARSIVRAHGGDIHLENRLEGGLRASITLPLSGEADQETKRKELTDDKNSDGDSTPPRIADAGGRGSRKRLAGET